MAERYMIEEISVGGDIEGAYAAEQIKEFIEERERLTIDDLRVVDYRAFYTFEDCYKAEGVVAEVEWNHDSLFANL